MSDYNEEEDARWLRAFQYIHQSGAYKLRTVPARTIFGWAMWWVRWMNRDDEQSVEQGEHTTDKA